MQIMKNLIYIKVSSNFVEYFDNTVETIKNLKKYKFLKYVDKYFIIVNKEGMMVITCHGSMRLNILF